MTAPQPAPTPATSTPANGAMAGLRGLLTGSARTRALVVMGLLALVLIFLFAGDGWLSILNVTIIAAIATLGLNVLSGYAGQISLGLAFFMGIGAYTAALLGGVTDQFSNAKLGMGLSIFIWLPASGIVAALVGALIGPTALRLKGFYLGIVTLALVIIGQFYLFTNFSALTGGEGGRSFPTPTFGSFSFQAPDPIFGIQFSSQQLYFVLGLVVLGLCAIFVANVARSRAGRAFQAVRDNETAAAIMGVNLFWVKMGAFVLSSFLAGIAGALWASIHIYQGPGDWNLVLSIEFVAALLIGGVASVWGSILGAAFVFSLQPAIDALSLIPQTASSTSISSGTVSEILYGVFIIVFLLFEPLGIVGLLRRLQFVFRRFDERRKGGETASTNATMSAGADSEFEVERTPLPRQADA